MTSDNEVKKAVLGEIESARTLGELEALQKANGLREDVAGDEDVDRASESKKGELMEDMQKITKEELALKLLQLQEIVARLSKPKVKQVRPKDGRKVMVDRTVVLPTGVKTPQVRQLAAAFKELGREEMTEAEVFEMVEEAKSKGIIRTTQPAVRIYRYYREPLVAAGMIEQV